MKFQNCILINYVTDTRTDGSTHTDKPKAICPFNFSKVGGIIKTTHTMRGSRGGTGDRIPLKITKI